MRSAPRSQSLRARTRAADFAGVADDAQAFAAREIERGAKIFRGVSQFVAAHAKSYDAQRLQLRRPASNFHRRLRTKLASGIQDERSAQAIERNRLRNSRIAVKFASKFCMRRSMTPAKMVISA